MFCERVLKIVHIVQVIFALLTVFLFSVMLNANNNNDKKKDIELAEWLVHWAPELASSVR